MQFFALDKTGQYWTETREFAICKTGHCHQGTKLDKKTCEFAIMQWTKLTNMGQSWKKTCACAMCTKLDNIGQNSHV